MPEAGRGRGRLDGQRHGVCRGETWVRAGLYMGKATYWHHERMDSWGVGGGGGVGGRGQWAEGGTYTCTEISIHRDHIIGI